MTLAYLRLGRFDEALTAVTNALQLNPKFANIHALHIVALVKLGRMDAARAAAGRLLETQCRGYGVRMLDRAAEWPSKEFDRRYLAWICCAGCRNSRIVEHCRESVTG